MGEGKEWQGRGHAAEHGGKRRGWQETRWGDGILDLGFFKKSLLLLLQSSCLIEEGGWEQGVGLQSPGYTPEEHLALCMFGWGKGMRSGVVLDAWKTDQREGTEYHLCPHVTLTVHHSK